jgi:hypothetical protein
MALRCRPRPAGVSHPIVFAAISAFDFAAGAHLDRKGRSFDARGPLNTTAIVLKGNSSL